VQRGRRSTWRPARPKLARGHRAAASDRSLAPKAFEDPARCVDLHSLRLLIGGATSYDVTHRGTLIPNGAPVSSAQAAACWLAAQGSGWGLGTLEHNIGAGVGSGELTQELDSAVQGLGGS